MRLYQIYYKQNIRRKKKEGIYLSIFKLLFYEKYLLLAAISRK